MREAIEELYYFEFVLDDIPIWGFVGYMEESGFLPHSHKVGLRMISDFFASLELCQLLLYLHFIAALGILAGFTVVE